MSSTKLLSELLLNEFFHEQVVEMLLSIICPTADHDVDAAIEQRLHVGGARRHIDVLNVESFGF